MQIVDQQLGKVFGEELGHEILKALVQFVCRKILCAYLQWACSLVTKKGEEA